MRSRLGGGQRSQPSSRRCPQRAASGWSRRSALSLRPPAKPPEHRRGHPARLVTMASLPFGNELKDCGSGPGHVGRDRTAADIVSGRRSRQTVLPPPRSSQVADQIPGRPAALAGSLSATGARRRSMRWAPVVLLRSASQMGPDADQGRVLQAWSNVSVERRNP